MKYENGKPIPPKLSASFRLSAEFKQQLVSEGRSHGLELGPYCEMLVMNASKLTLENTRLKSELAKSQATLSSMNTQHILEKNSLIKESEACRAEIKNLQDRLTAMQEETAVLRTPHLLQIFAKAKGETWTVERPDGSKFQIICNSPSDVMLAMIYSFDYKK